MNLVTFVTRKLWTGWKIDISDLECLQSRKIGARNEKCQQKRDVVSNLRAPFQPIITTKPRKLITSDLVEYPESNDGNRYALVAIDNFTKYLELFALNAGEVKWVKWSLYLSRVAQNSI